MFWPRFHSQFFEQAYSSPLKRKSIKNDYSGFQESSVRATSACPGTTPGWHASKMLTIMDLRQQPSEQKKSFTDSQKRSTKDGSSLSVVGSSTTVVSKSALGIQNRGSQRGVILPGTKSFDNNCGHFWLSHVQRGREDGSNLHLLGKLLTPTKHRAALHNKCHWCHC